MSDLIVEFGGKKYLRCSFPISSNKKFHKYAQELKDVCVFVGVKEMKRGVFFGHAVVEVLVAEDKLSEWNDWFTEEEKSR